ncbi:phosphoribosyltransferase [Spirosoma taeanense]|uniref:Phosphoribosyltransferase n=1 Tax=Spirosoma taeanense TaxID=2735870 RepID=A0A6M5Y8Q7_9BACT|nr:phosphoribosyltransferase [Spirosoma taeanense]QJW90319.1 phosphoribosyltransferase [Spirosoma taeanense]
MKFLDRSEAGRLLAGQLLNYAGQTDVLILALPRGGVPVAYEVALRLKAPLDVFIVRKLGVPGFDELAMGAVASGGTTGKPIRILNQSIVNAGKITDEQIEQVTERESRELERRERAYRIGQPELVVEGQTIILIDDGLATGATMRVAALALRQQQPAQLVIAVPVATEEVCAEFRREANAMVCLMTPKPFYGVGEWYEDFSQTTDKEVMDLLEKARQMV